MYIARVIVVGEVVVVVSVLWQDLPRNKNKNNSGNKEHHDDGPSRHEFNNQSDPQNMSGFRPGSCDMT